jgi:hypothetical protein
MDEPESSSLNSSHVEMFHEPLKDYNKHSYESPTYKQ